VEDSIEYPHKSYYRDKQAVLYSYDNKSCVHVVGTLRTGYPHVQASNQYNGSRLPADGSSEPPRVPMARAPALGSGQLRGRHVSPRLGTAPGPPRVPVARAPAPNSG
jgi:hypothetical protein